MWIATLSETLLWMRLITGVAASLADACTVCPCDASSSRWCPLLNKKDWRRMLRHAGEATAGMHHHSPQTAGTGFSYKGAQYAPEAHILVAAHVPQRRQRQLQARADKFESGAIAQASSATNRQNHPTSAATPAALLTACGNAAAIGHDCRSDKCLRTGLTCRAPEDNSGSTTRRSLTLCSSDTIDHCNGASISDTKRAAQQRDASLRATAAAMEQRLQSHVRGRVQRQRIQQRSADASNVRLQQGYAAQLQRLHWDELLGLAPGKQWVHAATSRLPLMQTIK